MQAVNYLVDFIFEAFVVVLILRIWLQAVRADFYNPISQFVVKVTNPVVLPCRRFIPSIANIDTATLLIAFVVSTLKFVIIPLLNGAELNLLLSAYIGFIALIKQAGVLLFMIMLVMAIMSWVVQGYNPTLAMFNQLTEPFLAPLRRIIPVIGGLDLSLLAAFLILNVVNLALMDIIPYWRII